MSLAFILGHERYQGSNCAVTVLRAEDGADYITLEFYGNEVHLPHFIRSEQYPESRSRYRRRVAIPTSVNYSERLGLIEVLEMGHGEVLDNDTENGGRDLIGRELKVSKHAVLQE